MSLAHLSFDFASLRAAYEGGEATPRAVADEVFARVARDRGRVDHAWLHLLPPAEVQAAVGRLLARRAAGEALPLFGLPFALKDNIDLAGAPTTVACPDFARVPAESAPIVDRLVAAGAIVFGKLNMDQFASGLVGVRSPYGVPTNPFDARMIPGGSSSGSAVAVAAGHVAFTLGTDTAGSGRVPAAFNNVVGLKPTRGALSTRGLVPACRSLDCPSVFALTVSDACEVAEVARGWDAGDPFSRPDASAAPFLPLAEPRAFRVGVPPLEALEFFGDAHARAAFAEAVERVRGLASAVVDVDFGPFRAAGDLLYGGPWVVERLFAAGDLLEHRPEALLPVLRDILGEAKRWAARDVFAAIYRLSALRQSIEPLWSEVDALLLPTAPTIYRVDEVRADPRARNANLGIYTTFTNLMDLAAVAVPGGMRADGLPSGIAFLGPRCSDRVLATLGRRAHHLLHGTLTLGATSHRLPALRATEDDAHGRVAAKVPPVKRSERREIVVVGAHLSGQPLNPQLTGLGGVLLRAEKTAPRYRLFALRGTVPPKPGLVRTETGGRAIDVEVWSLDEAAFGAFVAAVPRPLCIGPIELDGGVFASGFLCEPAALEGSVDISGHGGWRAYLQAQKS